MSNVKRLSAELKLAKAEERLEVARGAMHEKRTPARIAAYQKECNKVQKLRSAFRLEYSVEAGPGDAVVTPETVQVEVGKVAPR